MIRLPLRNQRREVVAYALIDDEDVALAKFRWSRSGSYVVRDAPRSEGRKRYYLHREVMGLERGDTREVDHINRNKLDCRRGNLRIATHAQNSQNVGVIAGTSQYRGVCWAKARNRWVAYAQVDGRVRHLGYFDREEDAGAAASAFRAEHMPFSQMDVAA